MSVIVADNFYPKTNKLLRPKELAMAVDFVERFKQNQAHPSFRLHRLNKIRSKNVWSARINDDLRAILLKDREDWFVLHADHHDPAYHWAKVRTLGRHSVTGAIQVVEVVETIREVEHVIETRASAASLTFQEHADEYLLSLGVPEAWLPVIRKIRSDEEVSEVAEKLPIDVGLRLLDLADGLLPTPPSPIAPEDPAMDAPDTRDRFLLLDDIDGLEAALAAPMDRWLAFLHPDQSDLVSAIFSGPAKVSGSAGTGKTVVAMHRAKHLAKQGEKVLFTTYVTALCENIESNINRLCNPSLRSLITIKTVKKTALDLVKMVEPRARPADDKLVFGLLESKRLRYGHQYAARFVRTEWEQVVRQQGIETWAEYRRARRTGRGTGLKVTARKELWRVFGEVLDELRSRRRYDWPGLCNRASELIEQGKVKSPYSAVIVDEVQDLTPPDLRLLSSLTADNPGNLMLCGDAGQSIYSGGFSLSSLGIEVRGRSKVLRVNYRTTEQIRRLADRLLGMEVDDLDGGTESRSGTRSLMRGPEPFLGGMASQYAELEHAVECIKRWYSRGLAHESVGVFARTKSRLVDLGKALDEEGLAWRRLKDDEPLGSGGVHLGTMHKAKGLEFKAVIVLDCGDAIIPHPAAIGGLDDPLDIEMASARERRLLYVAMTRARDELVVTWTGRPSRYLSPLLDEQK